MTNEMVSPAEWSIITAIASRIAGADYEGAPPQKMMEARTFASAELPRLYSHVGREIVKVLTGDLPPLEASRQTQGTISYLLESFKGAARYRADRLQHDVDQIHRDNSPRSSTFAKRQEVSAALRGTRKELLNKADRPHPYLDSILAQLENTREAGGHSR